jgi:hypothetical protein
MQIALFGRRHVDLRTLDAISEEQIREWIEIIA